jgi:hypothetical protein
MQSPELSAYCGTALATKLFYRRAIRDHLLIKGVGEYVSDKANSRVADRIVFSALAR